MQQILLKSLVFLASFLTITSFAAPRIEKEWTFLLFLNGHNNLSSQGEMNLKAMEKIGSNESVNFVVEWGQSGNEQTHRLLVEKSTNDQEITSPILMSLKDHDMGNYQNLIDFVKWGVDNFPAKHYFVAVWSHGSGWHLKSLNLKKMNTSAVITDISYDDVTENEITTEQLGIAMGEIKNYIGRNIDVYGSDACLMQMIEVASEMKNSVNYIVGSEELEPGEGWPYEAFFRNWTHAPYSTPAEIAIMLSKEYLSAYSGGVYGTRDVTFSALDISKLNRVLQSVSDVVKQIQSINTESIDKVKRSLRKVQSYFYSDFKDYGHLLQTLELLSLNANKSVFTSALKDVRELVLTNDNSPKYKQSTGMTIWLPSSASNSYLPRYRDLEFDKITGWSQVFEIISKK